MVLRPNSADESCSMSLEYTQPHDRSVAPSLVIEMANPRVLFLFRQTYHNTHTMLERHTFVQKGHLGPPMSTIM